MLIFCTPRNMVDEVSPSSQGRTDTGIKNNFLAKEDLESVSTSS